MDVNATDSVSLEIFKALSNPIRLDILNKCILSEISQADLAILLHVSPSNISQHIDVLESLGLIQTVRRDRGKKYVKAKESNINIKFSSVTNV